MPHSASRRLICLPPAGAGPSIFHQWTRSDPRVIAPAIPGREGLFKEKPAPSLAALAEGIAARIAPDIDGEYALFGYSLGGTVAYLLAERLMARGLPAPSVVFLLGASAPHHLADRIQDFLSLDSASFWKEIERIGGTPDEIINAPDLRALFEPGLRTDFHLATTFTRPPNGFGLPCPTEVFRAADDHLVSSRQAEAWREYSNGPIRHHSLTGEHMLSAPKLEALLGQLWQYWPSEVAA